MIIMGLDLATRSGWAVRDSERHRSSIKCGTFSVKEYDWEEKYAVAANLFYPLLKQHRPDFVAIEQPEHGVRQFKKKGKADLTGKEQTISTINPSALQLTGIAGAIIGVCMLLRVPYGTITSNAWRPVYYGKGVKPPEGSDWKAMAIAACEQEGIQLPGNKEERKDAAEAVAVCTCWTKCNVPGIDWMQDKFMALRTGASQQRNTKPASADLFGAQA